MDIMYDSLSLNRDKVIIWTMTGPFSKYLISGLIIAGNLSLWWTKTYGWEYLMVEYFENANRQIKERVNNSYDILPDIITLTNIPLYDISHNYTVKVTDLSKYVIWIFNGYLVDDNENINLYDLYEFNSDNDLTEFIQGISSMCNAFNLDITKIILACPLHNDNPYYIEDIKLSTLSDLPNKNI